MPVTALPVVAAEITIIMMINSEGWRKEDIQ